MYIPAILVCLFLTISCSQSVDPKPIAGGSDTESMVTAEIFSSNNDAVKNALFKLIPQNFVPQLLSNDSVKVYTANSKGKVIIPSEDLNTSLSYALLVQDTVGNESYYTTQYDGEESMTIVLEPSRTIEVKLDYGGAYTESDSALVFFKGTDIVRLCLGEFKTIANIPTSLDFIHVANDTINEKYEIEKSGEKLIFSISHVGITYF